MSQLHFKDADVDLILGPEERFQHQVHAQVLRENSGLFARLLDKSQEAPLSNAARRGGQKMLFHVELAEAPSADFKAGKLVRMELNEKGYVAAGNPPSIAFLNSNGKIPPIEEQLFRDYGNCLHALYSKPMALDTSRGLPGVTAQILSLLSVAEYLECMPIVSTAAEIILMRYGQEFFAAIGRNPIIWLNQAYRMKNEVIYGEALVHCVGKWNRFTIPQRRSINVQSRPLLERKVQLAINRGKEIQSRVMALYPRSVQRSSGENIARAAYTGDVMYWIGIGFFRHWFGTQVISEKGPRAVDGGFAFFTSLKEAGNAYLDRTVLNIFHNRFQMSKKASGVVENHILELKELVKAQVLQSQIMSNTTQLDISRHPVDWLVSCPFNKEKDPPWLREASANLTDSAKKRNARKAHEEPETEVALYGTYGEFDDLDDVDEIDNLEVTPRKKGRKSL